MSHRNENGRTDGLDGGSLTLGGTKSHRLSGNCPDTDTSGSSRNRNPNNVYNLSLVDDIMIAGTSPQYLPLNIHHSAESSSSSISATLAPCC